MKHKVSDLEGALLDAAVAMAERGSLGEYSLEGGGSYGPAALKLKGWVFAPSVRWEHGGPIIERERIHFEYATDAVQAEIRCEEAPYVQQWGPTLLIAAMRAYVASKVGEEVDLPG